MEVMNGSPSTSGRADSTTRFAFGRNWKSFLATLDEHRIEEARKRLCESLGRDDLHGVSSSKATVFLTVAHG